MFNSKILSKMQKRRLKLRKVAAGVACLAVTTMFASCEKVASDEVDAPQVSNITFTGCDDGIHNTMGIASPYVDVKFTSTGVHITHYNFVVNCAFDTVLVTQTFENGVLTITVQGEPNTANCVCRTDVSYTISGIWENEIEKIVINGKVVWGAEAYVAFGANYDVVNCISTATIFLDGENLGALQKPVRSISECGAEGTLTKKISVGEHTYRVEIRGSCTKDVTGTFVVSENECEKIFIDYYQIFN